MKVSALFNKWSLQGLDKEMEKGHFYGVQVMLEDLKVKRSFEFLDVGCGNGWVVRQVSKHPLCKSGWGIDVSEAMIKRAKELKDSKKQNFINTDLLSWKTRKKFDVIFSMEALYYIVPMEPAIEKIYYLLRKGGIFLCGVDYYLENKASHEWQEQCNVKMDLRSKKEWIDLFKKTGFRNVRQENILYPAEISSEQWKQFFGTLFTKGTK